MRMKRVHCPVYLCPLGRETIVCSIELSSHQPMERGVYVVPKLNFMATSSYKKKYIYISNTKCIKIMLKKLLQIPSCFSDSLIHAFVIASSSSVVHLSGWRLAAAIAFSSGVFLLWLFLAGGFYPKMIPRHFGVVFRVRFGLKEVVKEVVKERENHWMGNSDKFAH